MASVAAAGGVPKKETDESLILEIQGLTRRRGNLFSLTTITQTDEQNDDEENHQNDNDQNGPCRGRRLAENTRFRVRYEQRTDSKVIEPFFFTHRSVRIHYRFVRNVQSHRTFRSWQYNDSPDRDICRHTRTSILVGKTSDSMEFSLDSSPGFACNADETVPDMTRHWRHFDKHH